MMRTHFLLLALIVCTSLLIQCQSQRVRSVSKAFARRVRASPKMINRQARFSRFVQEPAASFDMQHQQQQQTNDEIDSELDLQSQLADTFAGQEKSTTLKSNVGYTSAPSNGYQETSTSRPVQQVKDELHEEDALGPMDQLHMPMGGDAFDSNGELSQNYIPTQDMSYSQNSQLANEQNGQVKMSQSTEGDHSDGFGFDGNEDGDNSVDGMGSAIQGEPGKDYPVFSSVPITGFKCADQQYPGYYADLEAQCQAFHICQADGRQNGFLCPNGTIFSQRHFVCVWWFEFDCSTAPQFYDLNAELYKEVESKQQQSGGNVANVGDGNAVVMGGSVPTGVSGSDGSAAAGGRFSSPKENFNKMYMSQIDEFSSVTTSSPMSNGYSNGKSNYRNGVGSANGAANGGIKTSGQQQMKYDMGSIESVTPSILEAQNFETTPFSLDEALGEEIHSEAPILEAMSLTTNMPKMNGFHSYGAMNGGAMNVGAMNGGAMNGGAMNSGYKGGNGKAHGNGNGNAYGNGNGQGNNAHDYFQKATTLSDYGFGDNKFPSSPRPSMNAYGGNNGAVKSSSSKAGKSTSSMKSTFPDAPVKNGRNGGSIKSKSYGGNGHKMSQTQQSNGNGSYGKSYSSYGGMKQ